MDFFEEILSKTDFVSHLKPEDARNLALAAEYLNVPANTLIFSESDQADNMYFIVTGLVQVFMGKGQAQPQELARLAESGHFGEQGFLAMNKLSELPAYKPWNPPDCC